MCVSVCVYVCAHIWEKNWKNWNPFTVTEHSNKRNGVGVSLHLSLEQVFGNLTIPGSKQAPLLTSAQISSGKVTPYRRLGRWSLGAPPPNAQDCLIPVSREYQDRLAPSQKSNPPEVLTGAFWTWVDPSVPWVIFTVSHECKGRWPDLPQTKLNQVLSLAWSRSVSDFQLYALRWRGSEPWGPAAGQILWPELLMGEFIRHTAFTHPLRSCPAYWKTEPETVHHLPRTKSLWSKLLSPLCS